MENGLTQRVLECQTGPLFRRKRLKLELWFSMKFMQSISTTFRRNMTRWLSSPWRSTRRTALSYINKTMVTIKSSLLRPLAVPGSVIWTQEDAAKVDMPLQKLVNLRTNSVGRKAPLPEIMLCDVEFTGRSSGHNLSACSCLATRNPTVLMTFGVLE